MSLKSRDTEKELKAIERLGDDIKEDLNELPQYVANALVSAIRKRMDELNIWSSGALQQSIEPQVSETEVNILANFYWKFVNFGVNGLQKSHSSPFSFRTLKPSYRMAEAINTGMANKGLGFNLPKAFGAAVNVKKYGLPPRNFIDVVDDLNL